MSDTLAEERPLPRPRGNLRWYRSLIHVPGLTATERADLKKNLPLAIPAYIDESLSWGQQDVVNKAKLAQELAVRFPCLQRYEEAWPVGPFMMEWLAQRKKREQKRLRTSSAQALSSNTLAGTAPDVCRISPERLSAPPQPPAQPVLRQRPEKPARMYMQARPAALPNQPHPLPSAGSALAAAGNRVMTPSVSVRRFLASLRPSMIELAPVLTLAGIADRVCLDSLIAMTHVQQRAFLDRLPLNLFQQEVIHHGLVSRRR